MFDRLLHEKAIESGCVPLIQTIRENNGQLQHLSKTFDYLIDARGVSAGEVTAIAIRAYWMLKLIGCGSDRSSNSLHMGLDYD